MKVRRIVAILMCCLMMFGTSAVAFAANVPLAGSYDLTIEDLKGATKIDLYRVVNIDESDIAEDTLIYTLNDKYQEMYEALEVTTVAGIEEKTNASILDACQLAGVMNMDPDKTADTSGKDSYTFTALDMGYYYIVMTGPDGTIYNPILWTVPTFIEDNDGNVTAYADSTVVAKAHDPAVTKEVKEGENWEKKANADIGDIIDYKLTVDVPKYAPNIADKDVTYKLVDELAKGLTWLEDKGIVVTGYTGSDNDQGTAINEPFKSEPAAQKDANTKITTLTMDFNYAKIKDYAYITVEYKAMLNTDAQLNETGNVNEMTFIYSDNAYDISDVNDSDKDSTTVYTYGLDILKAELGNDHIVLEGAEFELTKGNEQYHFIKNSDGIYTALSPDSDKYADAADVVVSNAKGKIVINGLDEGEYVLKETKAPEDYFIVDREIPIVITGEADQTAGLTGLVATGGDTGNEAEEAGVYFEKTVYNSTRYVLPDTGDKGFMIMLACGLTMMATAYVMFAMRRKSQRD